MTTVTKESFELYAPCNMLVNPWIIFEFIPFNTTYFDDLRYQSSAMPKCEFRVFSIVYGFVNENGSFFQVWNCFRLNHKLSRMKIPIKIVSELFFQLTISSLKIVPILRAPIYHLLLIFDYTSSEKIRSLFKLESFDFRSIRNLRPFSIEHRSTQCDHHQTF